MVTGLEEKAAEDKLEEKRKTDYKNKGSFSLGMKSYLKS